MSMTFLCQTLPFPEALSGLQEFQATAGTRGIATARAVGTLGCKGRAARTQGQGTARCSGMNVGLQGL